VVVLTRQVSGVEGNVPAHWDFAPGEGGSDGLTLSLDAQQPFVVRPGDIIVVFAVDGSRRYWGPNIVGETLAPFWDGRDRTWTTIVQP
jgi:hypothetical protein